MVFSQTTRTHLLLLQLVHVHVYDSRTCICLMKLTTKFTCRFSLLLSLSQTGLSSQPPGKHLGLGSSRCMSWLLTDLSISLHLGPGPHCVACVEIFNFIKEDYSQCFWVIYPLQLLQDPLAFCVLELVTQVVQLIPSQ